MEQMNKEDIIEYFIEQFGDNEILRRFMTKEQMRNKLNLMIKEVTYEEEPGSTLASWRPRLDGTGCVNFDMTKTNPEKLKSSILHEFIHILSSSFYNINGTVYYSKVGIRFSCTSEHFKCWNVGINEGITEALAEKIIEKKPLQVVYKEDQFCYYILSAIIGEDNMLEIFFSDIKPEEYKNEEDFEAKTKDVFKETLLKQYGIEFGTEINEGVKKVIALEDQLNFLNYQIGMGKLNDEKINLKNQVKQEIYNELLRIIDKMIGREQYINKKIDLLSVIEKLYGKRIYYTFLKKALDNNMNYEQRMEILKGLREKECEVPYGIVKEVLLESKEAADMNDEAKFKEYFYLRKNAFNCFNNDECQSVYEIYAKSGRLKEDRFCKKNIFNRIVKWCNSMQEIDTKLIETRYQNIGDFYRIDGEYLLGYERFYDKEGKEIESHILSFNPLVDENISDEDERTLAEVVPKEKIKSIEEQLKDRCRQYLLKNREENGEGYAKIEIIGNIIRLTYSTGGSETRKHGEEFFEIDDNGELKVVQVRRRKKAQGRFVKKRLR